MKDYSVLWQIMKEEIERAGGLVDGDIPSAAITRGMSLAALVMGAAYLSDDLPPDIRAEYEEYFFGKLSDVR